MSINPVSDLVLDVARAADPARAAKAMAKLQPGASSFPDFLEETAGAAKKNSGIGSGIGMVNSSAGDIRSIGRLGERMKYSIERAAPPSQRKANEGLEAFLLQSLIEGMMPKNNASAFGKGNAGGIFKSMLSEQLGKQMAHGGGIGIARHLNEAIAKKAAQGTVSAAPANTG